MTVLGGVLLGRVPGAEAQAPTAALLERGALYVQVPERLTPRVHVLRQRQPNFAGVIGNVTVIEQAEGLVLVDAGASHGSGVRIVEMVRAISPKPVTAVVLTHWHGDHVMGLSAIRAAWPRAEVIAHAQAAADIDARLSQLFPRAPSPTYEHERMEALDAAYADIERNQAAQAKTDAEREGWRRVLGTRELRLADVPGTHLLSATRTFADSLTLADARTPLELRFLGRANTSGDVVAWVPSEGVLVAGDIVVAPVPYMIQVYPSELVQTVGRLQGMPFRWLVPGHGAPQRDRKYLEQLSTLVRSVRQQVEPLARAGVAVDSIVGRLRVERERSGFAQRDSWLQYWFDLYGLAPLIQSTFDEVLGRPLGPSVPPDNGTAPARLIGASSATNLP